VRLILPDGSNYPVTGELQFSDVTVNEATGTVTLRALFNNPNHILLPGMFVQAIVSQGVQEDAILAPQQGVTRNAKGEAVALVVNPQGVVEPRTLDVAGVAGDKWVVRSGLAAGDQLIVEGVMRAMPGSPVTPKPVQAAAAPEGAAPAAAPAQEGDAIRGRQNDG
jgi:membrane fusion protein (multidrug efflux system)